MRSLTPREKQEVVRMANVLYFRSRVHESTEWMGIKTMKCPMDMWIYQELMYRNQVDLLIETGTLAGGSALFFAHMFDGMSRGQVVSVDLEHGDDLPQHPRIDYIQGSSISHDVLEQVARHCESAKSVMVVLDAEHKAEYKLKELQAYAGFVTPGNHMVAEDSTFDFFPSWPEFGPGPATAVRQFLEENSGFTADREQERHIVTFSPMAFLQRETSG